MESLLIEFNCMFSIRNRSKKLKKRSNEFPAFMNSASWKSQWRVYGLWCYIEWRKLFHHDKSKIRMQIVCSILCALGTVRCYPCWWLDWDRWPLITFISVLHSLLPYIWKTSCWGFSRIFQFLDRILMKRIQAINSFNLKLYVGLTSSVRIHYRLKNFPKAAAYNF